MDNQPEVERADYDYKKEKSIEKLAGVFEDILQQFDGEENNRLREDIANYTIGYMGVSFGLHVNR